MDDRYATLLETLRAARLADRKAFWAYGDACMARDVALSAKLDKVRETANKAADLALAALLAAVDESP